MNYTPAPWSYRDRCHFDGYTVFRFNQFNGSFQQWSQDGTKYGNAKLVEKAPEMYELLKSIKENFVEIPEDEAIIKLLEEIEKE